MSSIAVTPPPLSERRARTVDRLVEATVSELRVGGYDALTVRKVASRADVAPATAYTYFVSKEHLVTEVFARRIAALPETSFDGLRSAAGRVGATLGAIARLAASEPQLAAACTVAMLATDPEVRARRDHIGLGIQRRLKRALGPNHVPVVLRTLELTVSGALVQAGMGHITYARLPRLFDDIARFVVGDRP